VSESIFRRPGRWQWLTYLLLAVGTVFFLLPVWNWGSFAQAWNSFLPKLRNSLLLGVTATLLSSLLGSLNGYVLSKWKFPGANLLFMLMLFGMFIPYQSILIPMFRFIKSIGLYGTVWGLVVVHTVYGLPITTLIFRNYYVEVPDALVEATSIDGAGFFGIYRYVMFPLSKPASQPITVALAQLAGGEAVKWNLPMAGALLAALPTLIVYVVFGRYFIRGLLAGSIKG